MSERSAQARLRRPAWRSRELDQGARRATARRPQPPRFTARLTIDVTPDLRGRIKIAAFQRGHHRRRHAARPARARIPPIPRRRLDDRPPPHPRAPCRAAASPPDALTHVELTWIEKQIEHWIRFGRERPRDRSSIAAAASSASRRSSVFAFVRWASNDFGTVISRIDIVRAVEPGEPYQTLPFVRPAATSCCASTAGRRSSACCSAIDAVEALGIDPADARAGSLAARPQPPRRRRGAAPLHARAAIAPGSCAGGSAHDPLRLRHDDVLPPCRCIGILRSFHSRRG